MSPIMAELHCLEIYSPEDRAELLSAALALHVRHGWEEEDCGSGGLLARVHASGRESCLELEAILRSLCPEWRIARSLRPEEDWLNEWKTFFTPVEAGSRFLVLAPWMTEEYEKSSRLPVIIEPKMAFGTGHHASTALCLRALSDLADSGSIVAGQRFLDLGTGSGILGISAARLGLRGIGVDTDLTAVENALENRAINAVEEKAFQVRRGSLEVVPEKDFDLVLANILAGPLLDMAGEIVSRLRRGGSLVLSGILLSQAGRVEGEYRALGLPPAGISSQGEWAALLWDSRG
ncbi:MAG: 50S ribosomal protein L11 methyltransferase [Deltaproteobacteria bacterium]|jgi:ribosomal protein L11 methyltransferase|nr:50S ribosomal protein L11 methyltransferase [Deltaproteobacteria bacterium]